MRIRKAFSRKNGFSFDFELNIFAEKGLYACQRACGRMILVDDLVASFADGQQFVVIEADHVVVQLDKVGGLGSAAADKAA